MFSKKWKLTNVGKERLVVQKLEPLYFRTLVHFWRECKIVQLVWEIIWLFLKKLNIELPYRPAIPLLGIYPRKMKTYVYTNTCV